MRRAFLPLAALLVTTPVFAQNMSTGVAPWQTVSVSSPNVRCTPGGAAVNTNNGWWLTAPAGSQWVSCNANDGPGGNMQSGLAVTYTFSLNLNTLNSAGGTFSFRFAADNNIALDFGAGISGVSGATSCMTGLCFNALSGPVTGMFGATNAVVTATITNTAVIGDNNPIGFLVVGSVASTTVPEPQTSALIGAGLIVLGVVKARRRRIARKDASRIESSVATR